ncbi:hypothetical protein CDD81_3005 [Ophiocordyceps australis]|uniref:MutS protein homolog 3 n=1 Tax=Ophiocordyceps australis TaxID=1399860 RepID=A0A2C5YHP7_9HYPO|nr:hypothetical protein CDD81_3005 [Ophiocordyceps australis]
MAPSSQKKQQTLTSFFTPKAPSTAPKHAQSSPNDSQSVSLKRRLLVEQKADNGALEPRTKKAKSASPDTQIEQSSEQTKNAGHYAYDASRQSCAPETDVAATRHNEELHRRFVKKLGHPDAMSWSRRNETGAVEHDDDDGDGDHEPAKPNKKGAKTGKLTPMELQFLDIKRKHMDTILIVEVGYKFRFFGQDAQVAARELGIVCMPGKLRYDEDSSEAHLDRFASASIPVPRLPVHAKRLVAAGHKVGVVRQIETAALKKAGDNRNTPFVRKLTSLYTKGTYIDEDGELGQQGDGYLLSITETKAKGSGTDEKVNVGILAVQPATGNIVYDTFDDGFMRSEVETRLLHICPCEFVLVGHVSSATEKMIEHLSGTTTNVFGHGSRVERVPQSPTMAAEASAHVTSFYADKAKRSLLGSVVDLAEPVKICLSAMIKHLDEYGLQHVFDLTDNFESFSTRSHMLINGTTLESLEVYRNATDHSETGSLFWALDRTTTPFGRRLLRKWVGRPLLDQTRLEERLAAVEELLAKQSTVDELESLLSSTRMDLERSLIRIYYAKCTRPELLSVLQTLQKIASYFARPQASCFDSPLLAHAAAALPHMAPLVASHLNGINAAAARRDDKYAFLRDDLHTDDMHHHQLAIVHVEHALESHRADAAAKLQRPSVDYVTVAGIEYLIEVANGDAKAVPASWIKISGTRKLSRFHTPDVVSLMAERDQHREALAAACDSAFAALLARIAAHYQPLRDAVSALATLDCLVSLSKVAAQPGYTRPLLLPQSATPTIDVSNARHPMAERTLDSAYIPFSTTLAHPSPLAHLITGPNMGGKSSFVRALSLVVLVAQVGSYVPADRLSLTLCDAIHTRAGARDNLFAGESTFMVEVSETARILASATPRSLVVLDELGRGTSTHDGAAIAHAVLHHLVSSLRCLTLFITHYQGLSRLAHGLHGLDNLHMRFRAQTDSHGHQVVTFLYEVAPGVSHRSYGLNVARLARIPEKVLHVAAAKSTQMELAMRTRRLNAAYQTLNTLLNHPSADQLHHWITSVEQL